MSAEGLISLKEREEIAFSAGTNNFPFYTGDLEVVTTFFFAGNV